MARINIEDEFFDDAAAVGARMGNVDLAIGQALRLIRWSQQQIKAGKRMMHEEFARKGFSDHLMPEFATLSGAEVIVRGAVKHFAWLKKKAEAGAKGGRSKTEAKVSKLKQNKAKASTTEASFSSSSSFSSSDSSSSLVPSEPTKANAFVRAYCDRFKSRWGDNPEILGKDAGIAKRLAKDLGQERFEFLLDAYFSMPDAYVTKAKHPIALFETKLNEIVVFAESGQFTTIREARQVDDTVSISNQLERMRQKDAK